MVSLESLLEKKFDGKSLIIAFNQNEFGPEFQHAARHRLVKEGLNIHEDGFKVTIKNPDKLLELAHCYQHGNSAYQIEKNYQRYAACLALIYALDADHDNNIVRHKIQALNSLRQLYIDRLLPNNEVRPSETTLTIINGALSATIKDVEFCFKPSEIENEIESMPQLIDSNQKSIDDVKKMVEDADYLIENATSELKKLHQQTEKAEKELKLQLATLQKEWEIAEEIKFKTQVALKTELQAKDAQKRADELNAIYLRKLAELEDTKTEKDSANEIAKDLTEKANQLEQEVRNLIKNAPSDTLQQKAKKMPSEENPELKEAETLVQISTLADDSEKFLQASQHNLEEASKITQEKMFDFETRIKMQEEHIQSLINYRDLSRKTLLKSEQTIQQERELYDILIKENNAHLKAERLHSERQRLKEQLASSKKEVLTATEQVKSVEIAPKPLPLSKEDTAINLKKEKIELSSECEVVISEKEPVPVSKGKEEDDVKLETKVGSAKKETSIKKAIPEETGDQEIKNAIKYLELLKAIVVDHVWALGQPKSSIFYGSGPVITTKTGEKITVTDEVYDLNTLFKKNEYSKININNANSLLIHACNIALASIREKGLTKFNSIFSGIIPDAILNNTKARQIPSTTSLLEYVSKDSIDKINAYLVDITEKSQSLSAQKEQVKVAGMHK